jgi:hypothetical protein
MENGQISNESGPEHDRLMPILRAVERATGVRPHLSTVLRWCVRGARGRKLAYVEIGGRKMTTIRSVNDFLVFSPGFQPLDSKTPRDRSGAIANATERLRKRTRSTSANSPFNSNTNRS